ncbi:Nuclear y ccaat-box binding factor c subunit nf yc [Globisporangium polare]
MAPIKRALSSYMIFCNDRRKQITAENPGLRIGEIQKLISVQWKELNEQEKEHYVQLAAKDKARYEQEKLDNPVVVEEADPDTHEDAVSSNACIYQLGRVKKIIQTDPDIDRVSREALIAIAKASELFVQFLGTKSYENALFQNRRQIKDSDVTRTIQSTGSLDWLREDFPDVKLPPQVFARAKKSAAAAKERDATALPSGASFFKPQQATTSKGASADEDEAGGDE